MRLILGTHSRKGLGVFRDVQAVVERQEIEMRTNLRVGEDPQISLFSALDIAQMQQEAKGVGCRLYQQRAEERIIGMLRGRSPLEFSEVCSEVMEAIPIRKTQMNTLCVQMKARRMLAFDLPPLKRVPQEETMLSLPAVT